jgi:hypothetical protein
MTHVTTTPLPANYSTPSTLAAVIGQVKDAFDEMGNATPIMVGATYLERGAGIGSRVVFVPEDKPGKLLPPVKMGYAARMVHSCSVYCRAPETGDDITRLADVYALADLVISCVEAAGTGRIEWGETTNDCPTDVDAFGAGLKFSFTFSRDVPHSAARWSLPAATSNNDLPEPHPPPGTPAAAVTVTPTTRPVE